MRGEVCRPRFSIGNSRGRSCERPRALLPTEQEESSVLEYAGQEECQRENIYSMTYTNSNEIAPAIGADREVFALTDEQILRMEGDDGGEGSDRTGGRETLRPGNDRDGAMETLRPELQGAAGVVGAGDEGSLGG